MVEYKKSGRSWCITFGTSLIGKGKESPFDQLLTYIKVSEYSKGKTYVICFKGQAWHWLVNASYVCSFVVKMS